MMPVVASHLGDITTREWWLSHGVRIGIYLLAAAVLLTVGRFAVRRMQRRLEGVESFTQQYNLQRVATLTQALSYAVRVLVWTVVALLILGEFEVSLGPLLAGAGIAGVALGFGAQSLVRDFLSGFFILLEDQFGVGDVVEVNAVGGAVTGKIEGLSLRTTWVRAFDGTLHVFPNGNIQGIGNKSKGWARAIVDIGVAYAEDVDGVRGVLDELFQELREDEQLEGGFYSGPEVLGVERLTDYEVVIRCVAEVRPSQRWNLERELRKRIKQRFDERGVEIPFPHQVFISRQEDAHAERDEAPAADPSRGRKGT